MSYQMLSSINMSSYLERLGTTEEQLTVNLNRRRELDEWRRRRVIRPRRVAATTSDSCSGEDVGMERVLFWYTGDEQAPQRIPFSTARRTQLWRRTRGRPVW